MVPTPQCGSPGQFDYGPSVGTIGQRLLDFGRDRSKGVDFRAGRGFQNLDSTVGVRGRDTSVRAMVNGCAATMLPDRLNFFWIRPVATFQIESASSARHAETNNELSGLKASDSPSSIATTSLNRSGFSSAAPARHAPPATKPDPDATPLGDTGEQFRLATQVLQALGVRQDQIDAIASDGRPDGLLPLLAPIGGLVIKKTAYQGQYVAEGTLLFEIADLGRVCVDAQVFEDQLALVRVGQAVPATVPAFPREELRGHVEQLAPALDPTTRTLAVRFGLDNPGDRLRSGMLATVAVNIARKVTTLAGGATCPVSRLPLGTMGPAISVKVQGRRASVCCEACVPKLKATPEKYLDLGPRDAGTPDCVMSVPESAGCGHRPQDDRLRRGQSWRV